MINYARFVDEKCHNGECVKFNCYSYSDWKEKEKEIKKEFPDARCVSLPGLGYAGEYWYKIGG